MHPGQRNKVFQAILHGGIDLASRQHVRWDIDILGPPGGLRCGHRPRHGGISWRGPRGGRPASQGTPQIAGIDASTTAKAFLTHFWLSRRKINARSSSSSTALKALVPVVKVQLEDVVWHHVFLEPVCAIAVKDVPLNAVHLIVIVVSHHVPVCSRNASGASKLT